MTVSADDVIAAVGRECSCVNDMRCKLFTKGMILWKMQLWPFGQCCRFWHNYTVRSAVRTIVRIMVRIMDFEFVSCSYYIAPLVRII